MFAAHSSRSSKELMERMAEEVAGMKQMNPLDAPSFKVLRKIKANLIEAANHCTCLDDEVALSLISENLGKLDVSVTAEFFYADAELADKIIADFTDVVIHTFVVILGEFGEKVAIDSLSLLTIKFGDEGGECEEA